MSDITVNPIRQPAIGNDLIGGSNRPASQPVNPDPDTKSDQPSADAVVLSPSALATPKSPSEGVTLTDREASDAAAALRQQLAEAPLSATAKQNQAILSLLR